MMTVASLPLGSLKADAETSEAGLCIWVRKTVGNDTVFAVTADNDEFRYLVASWIEDRLDQLWADAPSDVRRIRRAMIVAELLTKAEELDHTRTERGDS